MGEYALADENGVALSVIVADQEFIDNLAKQVADPDVDTGEVKFAKAYDVTGKDVSAGHKRAANGKWTRPGPPEQTEAEKAALAAAGAAAAQRAEDDAFLKTLRTKQQSKQPLSQDERDRLSLIIASRGGTAL